jgi:hypothetical protein
MPGTQRQSIESAPAYAHCRSVTVDDVPATAPATDSVSTQTYNEIHVQVIQTAGALASIQPMFWSEAAASFVADASFPSVALPALSSERTYAVKQRNVLLAVTSVPGGETVDVYVSGVRPYVQPVA